jgi:flagellar biogenesis protein FliO
VTDTVGDMADGDAGVFEYSSGIDFGSMLLTLTRYAFVTFVVLVIFWALMQLLRRSLERTGGFGGHGRIRVVESTRLYGDKLVHIVRVDGKEVLIGSSRDSISYLGELGDCPGELQKPAGVESQHAWPGGTYAQRAAEASRRVPLAAGQVFRRLGAWAASAADRTRSVLRRMRANRPAGKQDDLPEETLILRDGARRVSESTQEFREILR